MSEDKIVKLLQEIRDGQRQSLEIQKQALEMGKNNLTKYEDNIKVLKNYVPLIFGLAMLLGVIIFLLVSLRHT